MSNEKREQRIKRFVNAYRNNDVEVEVIPSNLDIYGDEAQEKNELVGAYCRVSTLSDMQAESYELQKAYYSDTIHLYMRRASHRYEYVFL